MQTSIHPVQMIFRMILKNQDSAFSGPERITDVQKQSYMKLNEKCMKHDSKFSRPTSKLGSAAVQRLKLKLFSRVRKGSSKRRHVGRSKKKKLYEFEREMHEIYSKCSRPIKLFGSGGICPFKVGTVDVK